MNLSALCFASLAETRGLIQMIKASKSNSVGGSGADSGNSGRLRNCFRRVRRLFLISILAYASLIVIGVIPVNRDFVSKPDGIEIFVTSNAVHAELILPIENSVINWNEQFPKTHFRQNVSAATHVAIGWGDKGFFLETETWDDLKLSTAANALWLPSSTCLHVTMKSGVGRGSNCRAVSLSETQYENLVTYVNNSFQRNELGQVIVVENESYGGNDAFYESLGTYHMLNTCNSWVGRGLREAGVCVGWMTSLPKTVFLYLPKQ